MTTNQWKLLNILDWWSGHGTLKVAILFGGHHPDMTDEDNASGFRRTRRVVARLMRSLAKLGLADTSQGSYDITEKGRLLLAERRCATPPQGERPMINRIKWIRNERQEQITEDGRFVIRSICMNPKWWGYWGVTDTTTGQEFPCRTEASAKTAVREILKEESSRSLPPSSQGVDLA